MVKANKLTILSVKTVRRKSKSTK